MITLTRFNKEAVTVNADLVMCLETAPETTLTFVNGERLKVQESIDEVKALVLGYKRQVFEGHPPTRSMGSEA
ncbi:MAG: flagellar FlbD family protein [Myxococcota bacterium]|nr:flagellar FlbD family protein [Myxococcota bacterium]